MAIISLRSLKSIGTALIALSALLAPAAAHSIVFNADSSFNARCTIYMPQDVVDAVSNKNLDSDRREALKFLYAYMAVPDITGHSPEYYLKNIDASLKAKEEMPWGKIVPDREFRHFVLPIRVNNEDLDMSRPVFYDELKDRVKGLSMEDAILEVNHWCHEKATYRPSDARTSSPLSTVSQAIGRCGEESTFLVAALRSVGIPARQVYTPRWAHTDDNHAWVEAWANGKWYFLGACEPEPILNLAWFNSPATRGMMMHTNVTGLYDGPEEKLAFFPTVTTINVTENYAPTGTLHVKVTDADGKPAKDAAVNFCIYNYTEFYPAAKKRTDANGCSEITTGLGDMLVWAYDGKGNFGYAKGRPTPDGSTLLTVVLDKAPGYSGVETLDIVPPPVSVNLPTPSDEQRRINNLRLAQEDSIRGAYEATFASAADIEALATRLNLTDAQKEILAQVMKQSRGNHRVISGFLTDAKPSEIPLAITLLGSLCEKDRRDIRREVLDDALRNTPEKPSGVEEEIFSAYLLNPRVEREFLVPYREYFQKTISPKQQKKFLKKPSLLAEAIASSPASDATWNPYGFRSNPIATYSAKTATDNNKAILFVAIARACGIPARVDQVTGKTQYYADSKWVDVKFSADENSPAKSTPQGTLNLTYTPNKYVPDPNYFTQFSISKIDNGVPRQLDYDEGATYNSLFASPVVLDAGQYMLVAGQRMADGSVLASLDFFNIKEGETTNVDFSIREDNSKPQVIGSLNAENIYHDLAADKDKSILSTTGRGYYALAVIRPNHEPTSHVINEIATLKDEFEKAGIPLMLLFEDKDAASRFNSSLHGEMPSTAVFGIDNDGVSLAELAESLHLPSKEVPVIVIADTFNRVVFATQGYTIGTAERLLQTIRQLQ